MRVHNIMCVRVVERLVEGGAEGGLRAEGRIAEEDYLIH